MHPDTFPANPNQVRELDNSVGVQGPETNIATPDTGIAAEADLNVAADLEDTTVDQRIADGDLPQAPEAQSREGKLFFRPNELNQSGEDKEYFHPKGDHKFHAPKDANEHALTPDVEVTPDNTIKTIR